MKLRNVAQDIYSENGAKSFLKGIGPCLARGYICNAVTLPLFDMILSNLE